MQVALNSLSLHMLQTWSRTTYTWNQDKKITNIIRLFTCVAYGKYIDNPCFDIKQTRGGVGIHVIRTRIMIWHFPFREPKVDDIIISHSFMQLQWRHNEPNGVSNHHHLDGLFSRLFRRPPEKTSKPCVTGLREGNPLVAGGFPAQRASTRNMFPFDDIII